MCMRACVRACKVGSPMGLVCTRWVVQMVSLWKMGGPNGEFVENGWSKGLSLYKMVIQGVSLCKVGS